MKKLDPRNPFCAFAFAAVAFIGWVIYDANRPPAPPPVGADTVFEEVPIAYLDGLEMVKGLEMLHKGMPRPEVEELLKSQFGALPGEVGPVDMAAGFPAYRVKYRIGPTADSPRFDRSRADLRRSRIITLMYDARTVGHPLVGISVLPSGNGAGPKASSAS